jgi:outer membrane protein assembly factor BamB
MVNCWEERMASGKNVVFIGIGGHVVAVDMASGTELWRTKLKSNPLVTVFNAGDRVLAGSGGELFCLDPASGELLWKNKLKGLGFNVVSFSGSSDTAAAAAIAAAAAAV